MPFHELIAVIVQAIIALGHKLGLRVVAAVAIAFARSPMLVAQIGHDLQMLSKGRFRLGLGG